MSDWYVLIDRSYLLTHRAGKSSGITRSSDQHCHAANRRLQIRHIHGWTGLRSERRLLDAGNYADDLTRNFFKAHRQSFADWILIGPTAARQDVVDDDYRG